MASTHLYRAGDPTVVVDGVDICQKFDLMLCDEGTLLGPPTVKMNKADLMGANGSLDLSEAYQNDVLYGERSHDFRFLPWGPRTQGLEFEKLKTAMFAMLLGKRLPYATTLDPGYTFTGRWECSAAEPPYLDFHIEADPYKVGAHMVYEVQGAGGATIEVENGRRKVIPWITTNGPTLVKYGSNAWVLEDAGTWTIDGLRLSEGTSSIYFNSAPTLCTATLQDVLDLIGDTPCKDIPEGTRLTDHYFLEGDPPEGSEYAVRFEYDIQEL